MTTSAPLPPPSLRPSLRSSPAHRPLAGRGLPVALLLALVLAPLLAAAPAPAPARAQTPPAVPCLRRGVPDQATLDAITNQYPRQVQVISAGGFRSVPVGEIIPDSAQNPTEFARTVQAIYSVPPVACTRLNLMIGDLLRADGAPEVDVVAAAPALTACVRRHVPNTPTLDALNNQYPRHDQVISSSDFQRLAAGPAIPDSALDPAGFAQALQQIYGPPAVACTQLNLMVGDQIQASGEIDVMAAAPSFGPTATAMPTPPAQTVTVAFEHTGGAQTWTAPPGVTRATFAVFGAQGGAGASAPGGNGGWAVADLAVTPGAVYQINVGGQGLNAWVVRPPGSSGGFNGGGAGGGAILGGSPLYYTGGGGGATDVRGGGFSLAERLLVAGGGGGGAGGTEDSEDLGCPTNGGDGVGGAGGGAAGGAGAAANSPDGPTGGGGGQPGSGGFAGGLGSSSPGAQPGQEGTAGAGGAGGNAEGCPGAGGGGGYYGGGGGGSGGILAGDPGFFGGAGGGGGSGYGPPGIAFWTGAQVGHGQVIVTYGGSPPVPTATATQTQVATLTPQATSTPLPAQPTATATASVTPSTTTTPVPPTATSTFTAIPSPSPTATLPPTATATPAATATPTATATPALPPTACVRRHVPDLATLDAMTGQYWRQVQIIPAADFQRLAAGPAVPESADDPEGFAQALQQIYGPPAAPCTQLGQLRTGDLIQATGATEIDVVAAPMPATPTPTAAPPTPTAAATATPTPTPTAAATATNTPTPTPTAAATATNTPTPTPTAAATATNTPTPTPTAAATATNTPTPTPTAAATATNTPTPTPTAAATATNTPTPTPTAAATATNTPTPTPTAAATATNTPTPTPTPGAVSVTAEVVVCQPQGAAGDYTCTLRVTFGGALAIDTVWRVGLEGAGFLTTSGAPQVSGSAGCVYPPNPSPYYPGGYYDVNISTDGCQAGAVITLTEAVTGTAGASTTHSVAGLSGTAMGTAQATYVLPAEPAGTPTPAAGAASPTPTPSPTPARTATATPPAGPTATPTPAATATRAPTPPAATPLDPPRASDGQHLGLQPPAVQGAFVATHGGAAAQRWADEHEAELARPAP